MDAVKDTNVIFASVQEQMGALYNGWVWLQVPLGS